MEINFPFRDVLILLLLFCRMIDYDKQTTKETRKTHIDNLFRVVQFCENKIDCRRSQQLHYFGETQFNPAACKDDTTTTCDNCNVNSKVSNIWYPFRTILTLHFKKSRAITNRIITK